MHIYITTGTYDYLKRIAEKHPLELMVTMQNESGALLLHETSGATVFKTPRQYELLDSSGNLGNKGFVVMNNIPVTEEGRSLFEYRFKNRARKIENEPGFIAIRVLRPVSSNNYIILTVWENETAFQKWKESQSFKHAHAKNEEENKPQQKIFAGSSYLTKYVLSE